MNMLGSLSHNANRKLVLRGARHAAGLTPRALHGTVLTVLFLMGTAAVQADVATEDTAHGGIGTEPLTIDCLGAGGTVDNPIPGPCRIFSGNQLRPEAANSYSIDPGSLEPSGFSMTSILEFDVQDENLGSLHLPGTGLSLTQDPAVERGEISIRRVSTSLTGPRGTLTVGNNWSNFQDFLHPAGGSLAPRGLTAEQLSWATRQGAGEISVALESGYELIGHDESLGERLTGVSDEIGTSSPSIALSWRGGTNDSLYGISALGRELELDDYESPGTTSDTGWGLNLFGGRHFGELFAALSVTLGNSIDSFILGRVGDRETASAATRYLHPGNSININPTLNYRLSENSNIHLSVNRFSSDAEDAPHGVETLDTIHLGYTWTPWPSTRLNIEFIGKDVEGSGPMEDSNKVNIAASKRF